MTEELFNVDIGDGYVTFYDGGVVCTSSCEECGREIDLTEEQTKDLFRAMLKYYWGIYTDERKATPNQNNGIS